jgi:hypothetical protein
MSLHKLALVTGQNLEFSFSVILNLIQDLIQHKFRCRNKFGMTNSVLMTNHNNHKNTHYIRLDKIL